MNKKGGKMQKFLIIGANAAGLSAAVRIRKQYKSASIIVLEKSQVVSFGACGIPYYVGGEFNDIDRMTARSYEDFLASGIEIKLQHEVVKLDDDAQQVVAKNLDHQTETVYEYDVLLIASGASARKPSIDGINLPNCFTMHSRSDAEKIKLALNGSEKVAIIGGGFIGVEAAEAFIMQGKQVTIIEHNDNILSKTFDTEITTLLKNELTRHQVRLLNGKQVQKISQSGPYLNVVMDDASIEVDIVIIAAGFIPNTHFLKESNVKLNEQGAIVIDEFCQTNVANIFAAGDCATVPHRISGDKFIPLATTANKLGRLAGENMSGASKAFIGTLGASGIRVFELEAGRVGITENEAQALNLAYKTVFIKDKNRTDYVLPQTEIVIKLVYDAKTRHILGGQVCGSYQGGAIGRVNALGVAIYAKLTVDELGQMDFVYAPPFARTWDALNIAGNVAK